MRFPRSFRGPQGVQQPFAAQPVRRRQYGVHHQRPVDGAVLGVAGTVVVRHRQRCTGNN